MPVISAHGCETFYQQIGSSPKTILLLHGWRQDWRAWSFLVPYLSKNYSVLIPDLPGFGQSQSPENGWSTDDYITWLQDFLEKIDATELEAIIGHSYGGKVAGYGWLDKSVKLPTVKRGLFLIGPSGIPNKLPFTHKFLKAVLTFIPKSIKRGLLGSMRQRLYSWIDADADYLNSTDFQEKTLQKILDEDLRQRQKRLSDVPLHLCWGANDLASPLWMAYEWLKTSKESEVFVVPNAGHFSHQEQSELFKLWLQTWLSPEENKL